MHVPEKSSREFGIYYLADFINHFTKTI